MAEISIRFPLNFLFNPPPFVSQFCGRLLRDVYYRQKMSIALQFPVFQAIEPQNVSRLRMFHS